MNSHPSGRRVVTEEVVAQEADGFALRAGTDLLRGEAEEEEEEEEEKKDKSPAAIFHVFY